MKGESILRSQKILDRKRKKRTRAFSLTALTLIILIILPIAVVRLPWLAIRTVEVTGAQTIGSTVVSEKIVEIVSGKIFMVFPRATLLTYGKRNLSRTLMSAFPVAGNVDLAFSWPNTLKVNVTEREPFSIWCDGAPKEVCYFTDKSGFIYDKAPVFSSPIYVSFRTVLDGEPIGSRVADEEVFSRVGRLVQSFSTLGLTVREISFGENGFVTFTLSHGDIFVSLRQEDSLTVNNLTSLLTSPKNRLADGKGGVSVSYIDLRFGNKIFYK